MPVDGVFCILLYENAGDTIRGEVPKKAASFCYKQELCKILEISQTVHRMITVLMEVEGTKLKRALCQCSGIILRLYTTTYRLRHTVLITIYTLSYCVQY